MNLTLILSWRDKIVIGRLFCPLFGSMASQKLTSFLLDHFPMLPLELFRPIIEEVDDSNTICSLILTCKAFQHDAEQRLYHTPNPAHPKVLRLDYTHVAFLSTMTTNPRLASLVHTYYLIDVVSRGNPLWDLAKLGFRAMVNLKVLHFRAFSRQPAAVLLKDCPFQLEHLHWESHFDEVGMACTILPQQPKLRHLYLECDPHTIERHLRELNMFHHASPPANHLFADDCCPNLHSLGGNRVTIELLLPGRNIRKLSWNPTNDKYGRVSESVAQGLSRLETISLPGYLIRCSPDTLIHLRELRVLEIVNSGSGERHEQEVGIIKRLPNLRELVISIESRRTNIPFPDIVERHQCIQQYFAECPHLHLVDFFSSWSVTNEIWYQRWTRGDARPTLVSYADVREGRF